MKRYLDQRLRLQLLRVVDALELHGSLLKASAALGVSQPALTKSLRDFENIVDAPLFERHARGVRPTEAGLVLVRSSRRILAELKRTEEDLDHLSNAFGGVAAIGALPVAAAGLVPIVLARMSNAYPDIRIRIEEGLTEDLLPLLAARQIDLIVGRFYEPALPDGFCREEMWQDPMTIIAKADHPLITAKDCRIEDLAKYNLVLPASPQRVAAEIEAFLGQLNLKSADAMLSSSYNFTREVVLSTQAFTIAPPLVMLGDIMRGVIAIRRLPVDSPTRPAGVITYRDRPLNDAARAFIDSLRHHVAEVVGAGIGSAARVGLT